MPSVLLLSLVAMLVGLPLLAVLVILIKHKRWGVLLAGMAASGCALLILLFTGYVASSAYEAEQQVKRQHSERVRQAEQATSAAHHVKIASDAELIAVAAAKPRIELEDQTTEETESGEVDADEIALAPPAEPRPEWMAAELEENQHRFTAGPFTTVEQCRADARAQLNDWAWETTRTRRPDFGPEPPDSWSDAVTEIAKRFRQKEHLEKRQTSVGEVYLLHTLARIDDENHGWLDDQVEHWVREARRTRGVRAVVLGGGLAVGLLGCCHLLLRGGRSQPEDTA